MVSFSVTKEEQTVITKIVKRAVELGITNDSMSTVMDLEATHANGCPLDFEKLLACDDFNFVHDITGINRHIDHETGKLKACFLPRSMKGGTI